MTDRDLILCLDSATPTARVAVLDGGGAVRIAAEATADRASGHVLPLVAGLGLDRYPGAVDPDRAAAVAGPTAISVGRLALERRARGETTDLEHAVPYYGRPPDITMKRPR